MQMIYAVLNGVTAGMAVFLVAAGITLIFGILKILNFSHGAFFMIGAYVAFTFIGSSDSIWMFLLGAIVAAVVVGALGLVADFLVLRRLRGVDEAYTLIATFALLLVCNGAVKLIWGIEYQMLPPPDVLSGGMRIGRLIVPTMSMFIVFLGIATFLLLEVMMHRMWVGKMVRALAHDPWMASIAGINVPLMYTGTVVFSFALAGFAGALLLPNQSLSPALSESYLIQAFVVVIVGGLGNIRGAFVAALLFGLVESFNSVLLPTLPGIAVYVCMVLFLIWRPAGLLAKGERLAGTHVAGMDTYTPAPAANETRLDARKVALYGAAALAVAAIPLGANPGFVFLAGVALIQGLFALSWNLLFGFTGLAVFGHAGLFAVGAYFVGYVFKTYELPFLLVLAGGSLLGAATALVVGMIAIQRTAGIALAVLTMALGEILRTSIGYRPELGSDDGLSSIPRPVFDLYFFQIDLHDGNGYYWFICVAFASVSGALWWLTSSSFGRALRSIRQDPERASFIGIPVARYRLTAFTISGAVAAFSGGLLASWSGILTPELAGYVHSTQPMLNSLLGGAEYFWGPVVGAAIFTALTYSTRTLAGLAEVVSGGVLLAIVLLVPGGLLAIISKLRARLRTMAGRPIGTPGPVPTTRTAP